MADLSHYDFVEDFSLEEVAFLIAGCDPKLAPSDEFAARIETIRRTLIKSVGMSNAEAARKYFDGGLRGDLSPGLLYSTQALRRFKHTNDPDELTFGDDIPEDYWPDIPLDKVIFARFVVRDWLAGRRFMPGYDFDDREGLLSPNWRNQALEQSTALSVKDAEIDPADYPDELSAANIAFRAVSNGYGNPAATFKNRLIDYLEKHFTGLNSEAVLRVATVANPDKGRGRKKRETE